MNKIDALFISDIHLGSKGSNPKECLETLKKYDPDYLFIVGDFIDGWLLKKRFFWTQESTNLLRKILSYSKNGTKVIYITGNHDDFLRELTPFKMGNIEVVDEYIWNDYFITHGDLYDGIVKLKWLGILGSLGYEMALYIDRTIKRLGYKKSLSKYLKNNVKNAVKFITNFEDQIVFQAKERNCKGVICGHIHTPSKKIIKNIEYFNCGDWIENKSYIIYSQNKFLIKYCCEKNM
jgi:UDP-2,3-diacylglucosamine pyrophosphatase LpxH